MCTKIALRMFIRLWELFSLLQIERTSVEIKCTSNTKSGGGGGVLGFSFVGYVPLASQSPCSIIVYFVASSVDPI